MLFNFHEVICFKKQEYAQYACIRNMVCVCGIPGRKLQMLRVIARIRSIRSFVYIPEIFFLMFYYEILDNLRMENLSEALSLLTCFLTL